MKVRKNFKDLELWYFDADNVPAYKYQGIPFTGIVEEYYEDGVLSSEHEYVDGYQEGWIRYYYQNGQLDTEYQNHNNDVIVGTYREYDEMGDLIFDS